MRPSFRILGALAVAHSVSHAAQFVLFDVTFTYTKQDADTSTPSKSHYYVRGTALNPDRPRDWTAPVDYRNGTVHIRAEVIEKPPGGEKTTWTLCYIPNKGQGNGYGCTGTDLYGEKGVYERDVPMMSFWQNESIVWSEGIKQMDLVIKDASGGSGHANKRPDHEKFFPTKVRITMVQVSAGSTYDPSRVPTVAVTAPVRPDELLKQDVPAADHRLAYGPGELQFGELRLPKTKGPHPVAILIHGGCWADRLPNFDPRATTFELLRPMAAALAEAGIATWNIEYRRSGNPGGGWPGTFQDLAQGTDYLRTIAAKHVLDLKRVVVMGHSSGGQLAFWVAARTKLPRSSALWTKDALTVKAAMNLDGPPDLAGFQPLEKMCPMPAVTQFLGGTPAEQPLRYREGAATAWLPLGVEQEMVVGGLLRSARDLVTSYEAAAKSKGDRVTVTELEKAGHFDMLAPRSGYWKMVQERVTALLLP
jgi:acetyl esterase/lipase